MGDIEIALNNIKERMLKIDKREDDEGYNLLIMIVNLLVKLHLNNIK